MSKLSDYVATHEFVTVLDLMAELGVSYAQARNEVRKYEAKNVLCYKSGLIYENVVISGGREKPGADGVQETFAETVVTEKSPFECDRVFLRKFEEAKAEQKELSEKRKKLNDWVRKKRREASLREVCFSINELPDSSAVLVTDSFPILPGSGKISESALILAHHQIGDRELLIELTGERGAYKLAVIDGLPEMEQIATIDEPFKRRAIEEIMLRYSVRVYPEEIYIEVEDEAGILSAFMSLTIAVSEMLKRADL